MIGDKDADKDIRSEAVDKLIEQLCERAVIEKSSLVYLVTKTDVLIERYKKHGFHVMETGATTMIKTLDTNLSTEFLEDD